MWKPCDLRCRLVMLQQQLQAAPSGLDKLRRNLAEAMFLAFVCNLEDLFNPITLSYLVLGGATCIIQVES